MTRDRHRICAAPRCTVPLAGVTPEPFCVMHLAMIPVNVRRQIRITAAAVPLLRSAGILAGPDYLDAVRAGIDAIELAELVEAFDLGGDEEDAQCPFS